MITGATDGIGKQYAKELAKHGMNILLISRTEQRLIEVSKEIGKHALNESDLQFNLMLAYYLR